MSVRCGQGTTFLGAVESEAMMAGFEWATRGQWLQMARAVPADSHLRRSRIGNAIEAHRKMMAHIRRAKAAGAK